MAASGDTGPCYGGPTKKKHNIRRKIDSWDGTGEEIKRKIGKAEGGTGDNEVEVTQWNGNQGNLNTAAG